MSCNRFYCSYRCQKFLSFEHFPIYVLLRFLWLLSGGDALHIQIIKWNWFSQYKSLVKGLHYFININTTFFENNFFLFFSITSLLSKRKGRSTMIKQAFDDLSIIKRLLIWFVLKKLATIFQKVKKQTVRKL